MREVSKWGCFYDKSVKAISIIVCLFIVGGVSEAARQHIHKHRRQVSELQRCARDQAFYYTHTHWCDSAARMRLVPPSQYAMYTKAPRAEVPTDSGQTITVRRDSQASNDFRPDGVIITQTADDVANSMRDTYGLMGWALSLRDWGRTHPPVIARAAPMERKRPVVITTKTVTTTTRKYEGINAADCGRLVNRMTHNMDEYGKQSSPCT